ncbi:MAG: aspartyl protease family protein, partial [Betaproteobacteria bacterium]
MERPPRHARAARALARAIFALALVGVVFPLRADDSGEVALVRVRNADAGGLLMVEATVGGERSRWLIDTGSSEHLIAAAFADQLGLRGEAAVTLRTPVGAQRGERVTLPELQLGA